MNGGIRQVRGQAHRLTTAVLLAFGMACPQPLAAKTPGEIHCYRAVCQRVRTLAEVEALVGRVETELASYYDDPAHDRFTPGRITSSGEKFDPASGKTAASAHLPDGTEILVWNPANGHAAHLRVNDFGPFFPGRTIDVSRGVADKLEFAARGVQVLKVVVIACPSRADATYRRDRAYAPVLGYVGELDNDGFLQLAHRLVSDAARRRLVPPIIGAPRPVVPIAAVPAPAMAPLTGFALLLAAVGPAAPVARERPAAVPIPQTEAAAEVLAADAVAPGDPFAVVAARAPAEIAAAPARDEVPPKREGATDAGTPTTVPVAPLVVAIVDLDGGPPAAALNSPVEAPGGETPAVADRNTVSEWGSTFLAAAAAPGAKWIKIGGASGLGLLALVLLFGGRKPAQTLAREIAALEQAEHGQGATDPGVADSWRRLLLANGQLQAGPAVAAAYERRLLAFESTAGQVSGAFPAAAKVHTEAAGRAACDLAGVLAEQGYFARAAELYGRALVILEAAHPAPAGIDANDVMDELGLALNAAGQPNEAERLMRRALGHRRLKPGNPRAVARTQSVLGESLRLQGLSLAAVTAFEEALATFQAVCGAGSLDAAGAMICLSRALADRERLTEGWDQGAAGYAIIAGELGPASVPAAEALGALAHVAERAGDWRQAHTLLAQAAAIQASALGPDHPVTVLTRARARALPGNDSGSDSGSDSGRDSGRGAGAR